MLQYHFFFEDMFVQARVFLTPSVEEHSLWIFDHSTQKVVELENCKERMKQSEVFSWLPAGQSADAVIHRPDLELSMTYSKRYFGHYGPHWGYRFIQSSWTADATFRLGEGEAKYNYFKLLDGNSGELIQADSRDTYQQDSEAFATIDGRQYVAEISPLGEWMHDYKGGETNSRMQLRYCKIRLRSTAFAEPLEGYALNERCFGVLG
ncbi:unnamed protein product [Durusdinium trenchii]|uniref:Uncharacterized protein n=1 Tax=Durusdinium trenchii TaxID=1381693 RepID=A0ABP0JZD9_9DINO